MKNVLQAKSQNSCSDTETAHPTAMCPSFISNGNSGKEGQQNIALIPYMRMWWLQLTCRILGDLKFKSKPKTGYCDYNIS